MVENTNAAPDAAAAAAAAASAAAAAAAAKAGGDPWYKGADDAVIGHLTAHGWDKKTPAEAALEAAKSHFNLQKLAGGGVDKLAKIPEANDAEGWKSFFQKIGVPAKAEEYKFEGVKSADGKELSADQQTWLRNLASGLNLRPADALKLGSEYVKHSDEAAATAKAESTAAIVSDKAKLEANWGQPGTPQFDANMFVARQTAAKLGFTSEQIDKFQKLDGVGYATTMEMFRKIGAATGEAKWVNSGGPAGGVMTVEEAKAKQEQLLSDLAWAAAYSAGDKTKLTEMLALSTIIAGAGRRT
jgi:hypothetical protein